MAEAFISYPQEAGKNALQLANGLRAKGVDTWCAEDNLTPGDDLKAEIVKALNEAEVVIFVVAPGSQPSSWIQEEYMAALESYWAGNKKMFIPVLIGKAEAPPFLQPWRALRVHRKSDLGKSVNQVLRRLRSRAEPETKVIERLKKERNERLQQIEELMVRRQVGELLVNGTNLDQVRSRLNPKVLNTLLAVEKELRTSKAKH